MYSVVFLSNQLKAKAGTMVKLANRGHVTVKMMGTHADDEKDAATPLTAADFGMADGVPSNTVQKSRNLYADATVPSFFRLKPI